MQLFPAIDLRGGKVVRLTQGDYSRMTVYGEDPCAQARQFLTAGAKNLHVVDLDGAKDGTLSNYDTIAALAKQGGLYIEVGGGIRTCGAQTATICHTACWFRKRSETCS